MKRQSEWDIDLILCVLLVFLGPYFIFDIIVRQYVGLVSFQFSWVISMLCLARLTWFALTPNRAKSIRLNKSISIFIPIILIILYTLTLSINQPDFLADIGILYDNVIDNILKRGIKYMGIDVRRDKGMFGATYQ